MNQVGLTELLLPLPQSAEIKGVHYHAWTFNFLIRKIQFCFIVLLLRLLFSELECLWLVQVFEDDGSDFPFSVYFNASGLPP